MRLPRAIDRVRTAPACQFSRSREGSEGRSASKVKAEAAWNIVHTSIASNSSVRPIMTSRGCRTRLPSATALSVLSVLGGVISALPLLRFNETLVHLDKLFGKSSREQQAVSIVNDMIRAISLLTRVYRSERWSEGRTTHEPDKG